MFVGVNWVFGYNVYEFRVFVEYVGFVYFFVGLSVYVDGSW